MWKKICTGIHDMFLFGMGHAKYFLGGFFAVGVLSFFVYTVQADVALFFSDTYVEQGVEIPDETGTKHLIQYEHTWTDFKGVVPEGAEVNSIFLHLTWSKVARTEDEIIGSPVEEVTSPETSTTSPDTKNQSGGGGSQEGEGAEHAESVTETVAPEPVVSESTDESVDEAETEPEHTETPPTTTEPESSEEPQEPKEEKSSAELTPPAEEHSSPSDTTGFEEVSFVRLFPLALGEIEESVTTDNVVREDITVSLSPQESDSDAFIAEEPVPTSTSLVASDVVTEIPKTHSFEILYSLDGSHWQLLKQVGFDEDQELYVDLTPIGYEALSNLSIKVQYTIPAEYPEKIMFDTFLLELGYGEPLIEEVGGEISYDDHMPNFPMSTVISDVESENIRAVVLGRGGVFEFWYSVTQPVSGEVVWNKIQGGGPIDETAPIAIMKRTIFWLDRNQQTLYGFGVDEGSFFGVSFEDPERKFFRLPFEDEDGKKWEATFNAEQNVLEFDKVKDKS